MRKQYFLIILIIIVVTIKGFSQIQKTENSTSIPTTVSAEKEWDYNFYGFIRTDYIFDTRKSYQVREDNLNLYPLDKVLDIKGEDLNATGSYNFLSIVSRVGVKIKAPDVWGAKIYGDLEGDFFGNTEASIGLIRLRHAYVTMDWKKTSLTMGQTWYPAFVPEIFPSVANFNTGIMFNPFGWASQIKVKHNFTKELSFAVTLYREREFTTATAAGGTQNSASTNSPVPSIHGQFQFKNTNWLAGFGVEYKSLQPLTEYAPTSTTKAKTTEKVNSTSFVGFVKYNNDDFYIKAYGISGGNMINFVMLGGFVGYSNPLQPEKYEATKTSSYWVDIASNGKKIAPGLFLGYSSNDGNSKKGLSAGEIVKYYVRGIYGNRIVDNVWRASGRVEFKHKKFKITPELEYTAATWGDLDILANGKAKANKVNVGNYRGLLSCNFSF
jgi:hypothetical protein